MRRRCFTLLELMIAMAVLALVLGIVLPRFDLLPMGLRIAENNNTINSAFYAASSMAQTTGGEVTLRFESTGSRSNVRISRPPAKPVTADAPEFFIDEDEEELEPKPSIFDGLDIYKLDAEFALDEERLEQMSHEFDGSFTFYANGEADGPELPFTIGGVPFTLTVDRLTGKPTVVEEEE